MDSTPISLRGATRRRFRPVAPILAVVVSIVAVLVAVEVAFRVLNVPFGDRWTPSETALAQFDSILGWVYVPNSSRTQKFGSQRRPIVMHFDDIGARVPYSGYVSDPQKPTIILVGDSYTMGHGVNYDESLAGQLEALSDSAFQVVNLGVQAYGTDQALLRLKGHFHQFNTRAVIYTFINDHVSRNNNYDRRLLIPNARFIGTKPRFTLRPDGGVGLDKFPRRYEDYFYLRLWALVQRARINHGDPPALDLTRALIGEMRRFVKSEGAVFMTVHWRWTYEDPLLQDLDAELIDAGKDAPANWDKWRIPGDLHPTAQAYARVAGLIMKNLKPLLPFDR
jgi:hypothetical protein